MDEIDLFRSARPQDAYPGEKLDATRGRLLAAIAAADATAAPAAEPPGRAHRASLRRPAGRTARVAVAASLAIGTAAAAAVVVTADHHAGTPRTSVATGTRHAPASAAQLFVLAAKAVSTSAPPAGTRWIVTENRGTSSAAGQFCGATVKDATKNAYGKLSGLLSSCPQQPPASLPQLKKEKAFPEGGAGIPDPASLPGQPGPLLEALYRQIAAGWARHPDSLPGRPVPPVTQSELHDAAFDALRVMLTSGVTSPSPAVQLQALALIPGVKVYNNATNAAGAPGIAAAISGNGAQGGFSLDEIIFDPKTYQDIGGLVVTPLPHGATDREVTAQMWRAYYDAAGNRLG
jgi:hypothetical protein